MTATLRRQVPSEKRWSTPSFPGGWARAVQPSGFFLGTDTGLPMGRQPGVCQPPAWSTSMLGNPTHRGRS